MGQHLSSMAAALILLAGCAAQPTAPTAPTAATAAAPAAAAPAADAKYAAFVKYARTQGYRPVKTDDGKEFWCKDEAPIGSRLSKQSCISESTLAEMQRQAADTQDLLRQGTSQTCPSVGCN